MDAQLARLLWNYDPETGLLTWRVNAPPRRRAGECAGGLDKGSGYWRVGWAGRYYYLHRVAWLIVYGEWPKGILDHEDTDRGNNRILNLRPATKSLNAANTGLSCRNTSGTKGVSLHGASGKWVAYLGRSYLGLFETQSAAAEAYRCAAESTFGTFARLA